MDFQPTLTGELVALRPTVADDWKPLFTVAGDPAIWTMHPAGDRWREPVFRGYFDEALASGGSLTIRDRASGAVIGASRYAFPDPSRDEVEIGWTFLARACWGGDYNREVKRLMLDHAHRFVGSVVFVIGENNLRSRRAIEKIGGLLQAGRTERGNGARPAGHVYYSIAREGFRG
jgi:RimJ/RimL family protein N-acetyltransferase